MHRGQLHMDLIMWTQIMDFTVDIDLNISKSNLRVKVLIMSLIKVTFCIICNNRSYFLLYEKISFHS